MTALKYAVGLLPALFWMGAQAAPMAYVPNEVSGTVSVIDTSTDAVIRSLKISERPRGIAVSPDGKRLYVTDSPTKALVVVDLAKGEPVASWHVGESPEGAGISHDGRFVAVEIGRAHV